MSDFVKLPSGLILNAERICAIGLHREGGSYGRYLDSGTGKHILLEDLDYRALIAYIKPADFGEDTNEAEGGL
jgi:hypothetical protein